MGYDTKPAISRFEDVSGENIHPVMHEPSACVVGDEMGQNVVSR